MTQRAERKGFPERERAGIIRGMYPDWLLLDVDRFLEYVNRRIVIRDGIDVQRSLRIEGRTFKSVADAARNLGIAHVDVIRLITLGKASYL